VEQLNEFLHMGGYAIYVWSAFALSLVVLVMGFIIPLRNEKKLLQQIRKNHERAQRSQ
jgi:heme exporter protein D